MVHALRPLVICGPSGTGKSSILRLLFEEFPDKFGFSVSHTTRSPRPGEKDGQHYHFTTMEEMSAAVKRGEFIESATFSNNMYGTSKAAVAAVQAEGKICVLDIDVQGVKQVKKSDLDPFLVFLKPPSMADLEERLRNRMTESEESMQKRLAAAHEEMVYGETPGNFDIVIVNDNLEKAYARLREFILKKLENTPDSADYWCCLGTTSSDRHSSDYYFPAPSSSSRSKSPRYRNVHSSAVMDSEYQTIFDSENILVPHVGDSDSEDVGEGMAGEGCCSGSLNGSNNCHAGNDIGFRPQVVSSDSGADVHNSGICDNSDMRSTGNCDTGAGRDQSFDSCGGVGDNSTQSCDSGGDTGGNDTGGGDSGGGDGGCDAD